jgi:hypothetical protein
VPDSGALGALRAAISDSRLRAGAALVGFTLATVFTVLIANPAIHVTLHEDEAYMLTTLRSYLDHGHLYDHVFSQYGPFYTEFWAGIFSLFGLSTTLDTARDVTLVVWVTTALGLGLVALRLTRSVFLGVAVQVLSFAALDVLTAEPLHPGGLICVLLVAILAVAAFFGGRPVQLLGAGLGALVAMLVLTKINVGGLALISLALVCTVVYPSLARRRWPRAVVELVFVLVPLALTASKWGQDWAWHLGVHVSVAALAVVIALRARRSEARADGELWWIAGGFVVLALLICAAIIGSGTSLSGLVEGVVTQPLHQGEAFSVPFELPGRTWAFDAVGLAAALTYWWTARRGVRLSPTLRALAAAGQVLVGLGLALSVVDKALPVDPFDLEGFPVTMLAFVWVALVPAERTGFALLLLPVLAVLQPLHAFPVAGSQLYWGTFLLVAVAAVCVGNGSRALLAALAAGRDREVAYALGASAAVALAVLAVNGTLREPLNEARQAYDAATPLELPGSADVRLSEEEVNAWQGITAVIDHECRASFLTEPGLMTFYIWTEMNPPTGMNATAWPTLFDKAQQQRVIDETSSIEGLCVLRNQQIAEFWSAGPVPPGPLVAYLRQGFQPIATFGTYELLRREGKEPDTASGRPS